jgi:hypothetical protein
MWLSIEVPAKLPPEERKCDPERRVVQIPKVYRLNFVSGSKRDDVRRQLVVTTFYRSIGSHSQQRSFAALEYCHREPLAEGNFLRENIEVLHGKIRIVRAEAEFSFDLHETIRDGEVFLIRYWVKVKDVVCHVWLLRKERV